MSSVSSRMASAHPDSADLYWEFCEMYLNELSWEHCTLIGRWKHHHISPSMQWTNTPALPKVCVCRLSVSWHSETKRLLDSSFENRAAQFGEKTSNWVFCNKNSNLHFLKIPCFLCLLVELEIWPKLHYSYIIMSYYYCCCCCCCCY